MCAAVLAVFAQDELSEEETKTNCLNCKLLDTKSTFLVSQSYCGATDECLQDEWNYVNKWCRTNWVPAWMLDIEQDCKAKETISIQACVSYKSNVAYYGQFFNFTQILMEGEYCNIDIDATEAVARVAFRDTVELGVLFNRYELGNFIEIPEGQK